MKNPILRFLCGSVRFSAKGQFPERFINLAMRNNASLWEINRSEDGFSACVIAGHYKRLRYVARKTHTKMRLVSKRGLPFSLLPYRQRVGFVLGFISFCLTLFTMSNFIWIIEYPAVDDDLSNKIFSVSDSIGLTTGRLRSTMDTEALSTLLELNIGELSWAAVNVYGSRVTVDVRQYEMLPEKIGIDEPCNLVASNGGVVVEVVSYSGSAEVQNGDVVAPGDLLISGVVDDATGSVSIVHAMGNVTARTDYRFTETVSFEQTEPLTTGRCITVRRLTFFGLEIPLYIGKTPKGDFIKSSSEASLKIGSLEIPISYIEEKWIETAEMTHYISERDAISRAREQIEKRILELGKIEIISRSEQIETDKSSVTVTVDFSVYQDIAVEESILLD